MSMHVGGRPGSISTINVTPMADIMIVLLIIFMVATPFIGGMAKNLPAASHTRPRPDDRQTLVVVLSADGTAALGASQFPSAESLGPYLQLRLAALPKEDRLVYVKADASLAQGTVQKVLDFAVKRRRKKSPSSRARVPIDVSRRSQAGAQSGTTR